MKRKEYILRNDLAIQNKKYKKIDSYLLNNNKVETYIYKSFKLVDIYFNNIETNRAQKDLKQILKDELLKFLKKYKLNRKSSCLVVGLGNKDIISDALGFKSCEYVIATGYYETFNINNFRNVYVYKSGTTKESGVEPFRGTKALVKELKPNFIIVIDSLVCSHIKYLNSVIQISDIGITPGSGLANYSEEISLDTIDIPVIMMGVPTATFASTIIRDVMNVKKSHISFKDGYDFMVVHYDIDLIINNLSKIIGETINETLNDFKKF